MRSLFAAGGLLALAACGPRPGLEPSAEAMRVPGVGVGAMDVAGDIQVEARADTWDGYPAELTAVLPMMVRITNDSDRPLLIRYQDIQLHGGTGMTYAALPPFNLDAQQVQRVSSPYPPRGFDVAPHLSPWYGDLNSWPEPLAWDRMYYDRHYAAIERVELPTSDMIDRALPEGVLQPGGEIRGYVYLQPFGEAEQRVMFHMELVDARTGLPFGAARIPFDVRGRTST